MKFLILASVFTTMRRLLERMYALDMEKTKNNRERLRTQLKKLETTYEDFQNQINKVYGDLSGSHIDGILKEISAWTGEVEEALQNLDHTIADLLTRPEHRSSKLNTRIERLRLAISHISDQWLRFKKAVESENADKAKERLEHFCTSLQKSYDWVRQRAAELDK